MKKTTQTEIAKRIGISEASLSHLLSGSRRIDPSTALAISHGYKLSMAVLMSKDAEKIRAMFVKRFGEF